MSQAPGNLARDLPKSHHLSRPGGKLNLEAIAEIEVKFLQRLDQKKINREPDRPAPVGIPAEQPAARLRRLVVDPMLHSIYRQDIRVVAVIARKRADAVRRKEFVFRSEEHTSE